jgi:hypothetical protein
MPGGSGAVNIVPGLVKRLRNSEDCDACGNDGAEVEYAEAGGAYASKVAGEAGHPVDNTDCDSPKFICDYKSRDKIASVFHCRRN